MVYTVIYIIYSALTWFACYRFQVVIVHNFASLRFLQSLRTVKNKNHKMICQNAALWIGKTTIMHRRPAVQAAERVLGGAIHWLVSVMACQDSKLQILLHCCVIFRYQHLVLFQE